MTSGNKQSPSTSGVRNSQLAVYYFAGAALIAFALMSQSTLGNPFIVWSVVLFISACLIFISTPTGRAFVAKCSEKELDGQFKPVSVQREKQIQELSSRQVLSAYEQFVFSQ